MLVGLNLTLLNYTNMNISKILSVLCLLLSVNAFAVNYKAKPLDQLAIVTDTAQCISFNHRIFNQNDCKRYLGRDKVLSRGYQPIQIAFTNNSNKHLMLSLSNFSVPCIPADIVAENLYFNTVNRVVGWSLGALFFWPLIIPAIIEGVESPKANNNLEKDYYSKALTNQIVKPYSSVEGLIFVPVNSYYRDFSYSVTDSKNNQKFLLTTSCPINYLSSQVERTERKG
jgi:hypothetical protein